MALKKKKPNLAISSGGRIQYHIYFNDGVIHVYLCIESKIVQYQQHFSDT